MGGLYCCIVDGTHLGNGTKRGTATMAAPQLLTSGLVKYESWRHSKYFLAFCVCEGIYAGDGLG